MLSAAWGRHNNYNGTYRYLAKIYQLQVEKKPDQDVGRRLALEGLTELPETVVELKGTIRELDNNKTTKFKLWIEDTGHPNLPIRFEYKARSFLRVSFERDPSQQPDARSAGQIESITASNPAA